MSKYKQKERLKGWGHSRMVAVLEAMCEALAQSQHDTTTITHTHTHKCMSTQNMHTHTLTKHHFPHCWKFLASESDLENRETGPLLPFALLTKRLLGNISPHKKLLR